MDKLLHSLFPRLDPITQSELLETVLADDGEIHTNTSESSDGQVTSNTFKKVDGRKNRPYRTRAVVTRPSPQDSIWFKKWLHDEILFDDKKEKLFRKEFRVQHRLFNYFLDLFTAKGWYDSLLKDALGRPCAPLTLLLLGVFSKLGNNTKFDHLEEFTNISHRTHRDFFSLFCEKLHSVKDNYISFAARDVYGNFDQDFKDTLEDYRKIGLPGCAGSVDCVHLRWKGCPVNLVNSYQGAKDHPSISYEVITNHRRKILSVSIGHPGSRNDKTISKFDHAIIRMEQELASVEWELEFLNETIVCKGLYLLSDGGYYKAPWLLFGYKKSQASKIIDQFSSFLGSKRKDVECTFGILRKRFKILDDFFYFQTHRMIDHIFVSCCVIHNLIMQEDGYYDYTIDLDDSLEESSGFLTGWLSPEEDIENSVETRVR